MNTSARRDFVRRPTPRLLHNMSAPPRTTITIEVKPVFGAVAFCLSQCLRLNGFFDHDLRIRQTDFRALGEAARKWASDPAGFWRQLAAKGSSRERADASAREFGGTRIGWAQQVYPQTGTCVHYPGYNRICADLNLCLAILSRRVESLFLSYRAPDYKPEQLFHWAFVIDDPRLIARSIPWELWPLKDDTIPASAGPPKPEACPLENASRLHRPPGLKPRSL